MDVKLFLRNDGCPKCEELKKGLGKNLQKVPVYFVDTLDGLAEAAYNNVLATPTLIYNGTHVVNLEEIKKIVSGKTDD
jgi:predicted thioredoxin/glutaredoxin